MPSNKEVNAAIHAYILEKHVLTSEYQFADKKRREEIIEMHSDRRSTKIGMIKALEAAAKVRRDSIVEDNIDVYKRLADR